jgi:hypothetical protein
MAPAFRIVQGSGIGVGHDDNKILAAAGLQNLSPSPCNLYDLWTEYTIGLGERKPVSQISLCECQKSEHKFFCRNVVWKMVKQLVDLGITSDMAIDQIYAEYGAQTSATKVVNASKSRNVIVL